ncbi:MAG: adenylosuccinate synthase [Calditrichaeota bacterium]|nr:adenylosuccinate synthase [Calditrichota bacterium]MCB9475125.1 adenylosuccinate synthase [Candidatus Delongbacteria bacterium]
MPVSILVGGQWGDEGKGKIVDALSPRFKAVVRYQGGPNAGHTVVRGGRRLVLHQLPTGILHPDCLCYISPGVVLDPWALRTEIAEVQAAGHGSENLIISPACHVIMPWHLVLDDLAEREAGQKAIGTTRRGIGPCYVDKISRRGLRFADFLDPARLIPRIQERCLELADRLKAAGLPLLDVDQILEDSLAVGRELQDYLGDTSRPVNDLLAEGADVLMEGAQGALLDVDWGTYPFVTSSNPIAGGACTGGGVSPMQVRQVIGIFKAYTTRVGNGPFPSAFDDPEFEDEFRRRAGEFGATTGRPRRCGWFDMVAARQSARVNGFTDLAITKLDILDGVKEILVCTAYRLNGVLHEHFPEDTSLLEGPVEPIWSRWPGWQGQVAEAKSYEDLPVEARTYLEFLADSLNARLSWVSTGPERSLLLSR